MSITSSPILLCQKNKQSAWKIFGAVFALAWLISLPFIFWPANVSYAIGGVNVYYSVGQNTADHKTGSPTISIAAGTATFSVPQTAVNMGVGDKISYGFANATTTVYISAKQSNTVWNVITRTGTQPTATTTAAVLKISHTFSSLSLALPSGAGGAKGASYLNTANLVTGNYVLNIPCYYDSGPDTAAVTIDGWTTGLSNFIKVYTPNNTVTEANQSQRHAGKWDDEKYRLELTSGSDAYAIMSYVSYLKIDGLQVKAKSTGSNYVVAIGTNRSGVSVNLWVSNNILRGELAGNGYSNAVVDVNGGASNVLYVWNNIMYGWLYLPGNSNQATIWHGPGTMYAYNNTIYGGYIGIRNASGNVLVAKNNLAYNNVDNYLSSFAASSTNNLSGPTQSDAPGSNPQNSKTVNFISASSSNFHLFAGDTNAKDYGVNLSGDFYIPYNTDIDGQTRTGTWDIGADEYIPLNISAVGTSTASTTAVITWTTDAAATSTVNYGLTSGHGSASSSSSFVTSHSITLRGLNPSTIYHFRVGSADASGVVATSSDYTFTTMAGDDITPPVITLSATSTTATTATITWTTNENATSSVRYGTSISYGSASSSNVFASSSPPHSITLRNLANSTIYHFQIGSTDASGNRATSSDWTFFTLAGSQSETVSDAGPVFLVPIPPLAPEGGFKIQINQGASASANRIVALDFRAGPDVKKMAISLTGDFSDANQEDYQANKQWDLCSGHGGLVKVAICLDGKYTVYVKFFTIFGISSPIISSSIVLQGSGLAPAAASLIGAGSEIVNAVAAAEAEGLLSEDEPISLAGEENKIYLKIAALAIKPLTASSQNIIARFIHFGTPTTRILGAGERAGSISSFQSAYGYLPETLADWRDVIKIANGRWPKMESPEAIKRAKLSFEAIYEREANMNNVNDNAAVTVMAYGLRPALRNLNSEKAGIKTCRAIFKREPATARAWDAVRAIAYSGAKR